MTIHTLENQIQQWSNRDNADFYENTSPTLLDDYAHTSGLNSGCDVDLIWPYIKNAKNILEVGAGYGRVIDHLFRLEFKGAITAIERSPTFCERLRSKYQNRVEILQEDLNHVRLPHQFDAILWMWSGITDFNKDEQKHILKHITQFLSPRGILAIDTVLSEEKIKNSGGMSYGQYYVIQKNRTQIFGFKLDVKSLEAYGRELSLTLIKRFIPYQTETGYKRNLHIFSNGTASRNSNAPL